MTIRKPNNYIITFVETAELEKHKSNLWSAGNFYKLIYSHAPVIFLPLQANYFHLNVKLEMKFVSSNLSWQVIDLL